MWPDLKREVKKSYGTCLPEEWEARKDNRLIEHEVGHSDSLLGYQRGTDTSFPFLFFSFSKYAFNLCFTYR